MFFFPFETRELDDEVRRQAGGSYVGLPGGVTHYELGNPTHERTVVLVHGFSVPYYIFDPTFHFLTQHGFRTLRYDLFGRGFSDRPQAEYNIDLFVDQLRDLLDVLRLTRPVILLGLSMGGPIAAAFTTCHPERVDRLILIDPAGAQPITTSRLLKVAARPIAGEVLFALAGTGYLIHSLASDFFNRELVDHFQQRYRIQMLYKGFRRALLSTIRSNMLESFLETYRNVGRLDKPVLLIWGRHDITIPLSHSDVLRAAIPHSEFHIIEDSSHIPHYEQPEQTHALLLAFLRK